MDTKDRLKRAVVPLVILSVAVVANVLQFLHVLAGPTQLLSRFGNALASGSVGVLVLATAAENIVILNALFPFAVVILFAMASTHGHPHLALATFATIYVTSGAAQHLNFIGGRVWRAFASNRRRLNPATGLGDIVHERPQLVARTMDPSSVQNSPGNRLALLIARGMLSYGHPQSGSTCSFDLGWFRARYSDFLICWLIPSFLWNAGWGIAMYRLGAVPGSAGAFVVMFYAYLVGLTVYRMREQVSD